MMLYIAGLVLFSDVPVCALENLALKRSTWEKHPWPNSNYGYGSNNAVDGMYTYRGIQGQCTINADGYYTAEWRVDLESVVSISYINIYYRTDDLSDPGEYVKRMAGFSLYVSNTTSKDQGYLCYKDQSKGTPSVDQNISCSTYGRYVIYYNERSPSNNSIYLSQYAYNELCEVEVYGNRRSYGDCCQNPCPQNCLNGKCDAYTGQCKSCLSGYYGQYCTTECQPGHYGNNCSNQCSLNCNVTRSCDKYTGQCEGGCMRGWTGDTCDQMCVSGNYGKNCSDQCSLNCDVIRNCDRVTGECDKGCKPGWIGNTCDQVCEPGYYGKNCSNQCSINCDMIRSCNRFTGECDRGCKPGWTGIHCDHDGSSNQQLCEDNTFIVIGVVLAVVVVLIGSVFNFIYWRRNTVINAQTRHNHNDPNAENEDRFGNTSQHYTELGEINRSSNYDEPHNF